MSGPMLDAALAYARRGWPVFPLKSRAKVPLTEHGFKQATLDERDIRRWWTKYPTANIGLRCGVEFDVVDIDGPEGLIAINGALPFAERMEDDETIDGPTCATGGGGWHVYVLPASNNRAGFLPKCDWRGDGGYVVAPPSIHPSGEAYRWLDGWGLREQRLRPVPAWLRALLDPPAVQPSPSLRQSVASSGTSYGQRALEGEIVKVALAPEGQRNHQLNAAAFAVGQLIAGGAIEDAVSAVEMLHLAGLRAGLTEQECIATIRSGVDSGSRQPRSAPARKAG
jgi:hypothetical protein